MRSAIAGSLVVGALVCSFLFAMGSVPAPYSSPQTTFTKQDERDIAARFPGGRYASVHLYVFCEIKPGENLGKTLLIRADGQVTYANTTCWRRGRPIDDY